MSGRYALFEHAQNWAIGSDPGMLRLQMAARTTAALAVALLVLYLLTRATGQPLTVALLGVVIAANAAELPWLIVAVVVGTLCSFVMSSYVLPDRPEPVLRRTVRALRARMATVVDLTAEALQAGRFDERRRRLQARTARLNETALMVQAQLEDKVKPAWPGVAEGELSLRVFDAELTVERVAGAGARAAVFAADMPAATRAELTEALRALATGLRAAQTDGLGRAVSLAEKLVDQLPDPTAADADGVEVHHLARAIIHSGTAAFEIWELVERAQRSAAPRLMTAHRRRNPARTSTSQPPTVCAPLHGRPSRWPSPRS